MMTGCSEYAPSSHAVRNECRVIDNGLICWFRYILLALLLATAVVFLPTAMASPSIRCVSTESLSPGDLIPPFTLGSQKACFPANNPPIRTGFMPYLYFVSSLFAVVSPFSAGLPGFLPAPDPEPTITGWQPPSRISGAELLNGLVPFGEVDDDERLRLSEQFWLLYNTRQQLRSCRETQVGRFTAKQGADDQHEMLRKYQILCAFSALSAPLSGEPTYEKRFCDNLLSQEKGRTSLFVALVNGRLKAVLVSGQVIRASLLNRFSHWLRDKEQTIYQEALAQTGLLALLPEDESVIAAAAGGDGGDPDREPDDDPDATPVRGR